MFLTIHSRCSSSVLKRSGLRDTAPESGQNLRLNTCINTAPGAKHPSNTHLPLSSTLPHLIMPPWPKASQATDMLCLSKLFRVLPGFEKHRTAFTTYCIMARSVIDFPTLHLHLHISGVLISCFLLFHGCILLGFFFPVQDTLQSLALLLIRWPRWSCLLPWVAVIVLSRYPITRFFASERFLALHVVSRYPHRSLFAYIALFFCSPIHHSTT